MINNDKYNLGFKLTGLFTFTLNIILQVNSFTFFFTYITGVYFMNSSMRTIKFKIVINFNVSRIL